jgi:two-component system OmpR family sensor kinase
MPALGTPEGRHGYATAMGHVALAIGGADLPLLIAVGVLAYFLARQSLRPLIEAREREQRFAADAAHEMRSPLATIATVAQAAQLDADGPSRVAFETIARTALDASGLIADLLTLAREPRGGLLQREPVDLAIVVASCARELQARAKDRFVTLEVRPGSAIVNGDERRLRELARNLIDNALAHAHVGVTVESTVERGEATIRVSDDGDGVAPEIRGRIFERFFHGRGDGSGLGLSIAHWIANAHGGSLTLAETAKGATFVARFPVV